MNRLQEGMMALGFETLFQLQLKLQEEAFDQHPGELDVPAQIEFLRWNFLAMLDEAHEALQEVGWKPWAESRHVHTERIAEEFVDMLHFFANICLAAGVTGDMLAEGYMAKNQKNRQRQADGYDGRKEKCSNCHRDFEEINPHVPELSKWRTSKGELVCGECYAKLEPTP